MDASTRRERRSRNDGAIAAHFRAMPLVLLALAAAAVRPLSPARRAAVPAIAAALATGVSAASLGDTDVLRYGAFAYIAAAGAALAIPRAITAQLIAGQLLAGPSGFLAIVLASAACFGLGHLLVRSHAGRDDAHS